MKTSRSRPTRTHKASRLRQAARSSAPAGETRDASAPKNPSRTRPHPRAAGGDESRPSQAKDRVLLYGFHSVREALRSSRRQILALWATEGAAEKLGADLAARGISAKVVTSEEITRRLPPEAVHQGLLLEARPLEPIAISDLPADGLVIVLDQVTDPHNIGAILRSAAAFGVDAVITTERHSPALTGVLAKAASGALEHVAIASVVNLARALEELGDRNYLRVGLDSEAAQNLDAIELMRPLALVLGAEGKGLRRLTRENCDALTRLDLPGKIKSLNVSNACAVALTIATRKLAGLG